MALRCLSSFMFGYRLADDTRTDVSVCPRQRACPWENGKAIKSASKHSFKLTWLLRMN